jgi:predicted dehydrogenase
MTLQTVVVGCGSIGSRHIGNLVEFEDVVVSAHDLDPDRVAAVEDEYGVPATTDLDSALSDDADCVIVCTPPHTHLDIATTALDVGAHVFVEKPLSSDLAGAEEFVDRANKTDRVVHVECNMRFHPPVQRIQEWLDAGEIGPLQFCRLRYGNDLRNWRSTDYRESYSSSADAGGGIILDAVHEIDLALEWIDRIETVQCAAKKLSSLELDVEDTAEIILESDSEMAELHVDYIRPERIRTYELSGRDGIIRWVGQGKNPEVSTVSLFRRETETWETREYESTLNEQYVAEMEDFFACVRGEKQPPVDADRGREILDIALTARGAARASQPEQR